MTYNLDSKDYEPLHYPHWVKKEGNILNTVSVEGKLLKPGDTVCSRSFGETKILEILQSRLAFGQHSVINPIFQSCRI